MLTFLMNLKLEILVYNICKMLINKSISRISSDKNLTGGSSELGCFTLFFDEDLLGHNVKETNKLFRFYKAKSLCETEVKLLKRCDTYKNL